MARNNLQHGFTLVELLVVIAIIGILMSLSLPAIQSVRESGRRTQCANNLRNISQAFNTHVSQHGYYPTGGWGWSWGADVDRGFGMKQPGGWGFSILPYIEEGNLHTRGKGMDMAAKTAAALERAATPIAAYNCPSRRRAEQLPVGHAYVNIPNPGLKGFQARADYASCGGNNSFDISVTGPGADALDLKTVLVLEKHSHFQARMASINKMTGASHVLSEVKPAKIYDGLSKTYAIGERYMNNKVYDTGTNHDDNQSWEAGYDWDTYRWTHINAPPLFDLEADQPGGNQNFGSPHLAGFTMAFCDGSVRLITYDISPGLHSVLGGRADSQLHSDGKTYDLSELAQ